MIDAASRILIVDLEATARQWALGAERAELIRRAAPVGWQVRVVTSPTASDGDGGMAPSDEAVRSIRDAEVYFGFGMSRPLYLAAHSLRWVHSGAAGVGGSLFQEMRDSDVVLTNSAGIHAIPIAEHVVGGVLYLLRGFDIALGQQRDRVWSREAFAGAGSKVRELKDCRALIVGAGGIGTAIASRLSGLGVVCTGIRRSPQSGAPTGFARMAGPDDLEALLPEAHLLILAAPATPETRQLISARRLQMLPEGAIVVNVARGSLVDELALAKEIQSNRLRGAVLDVFEQEPLDTGNPLWTIPSVLLTPHVSPVSPNGFWPRALELFLDNWARYVSGQPLRNIVDKAAGY